MDDRNAASICALQRVVAGLLKSAANGAITACGSADGPAMKLPELREIR